MNLGVLGLVLLAIATLLVGVSIGYYFSPSNQANSLRDSILQYASVVGAAIVVIRFVTEYLKQNVFEYGGIYKKQELRVVVGKREHGWGNEEKERRNEIGYYLRIKKKRGQGRLENCEGQITIEEKDGSKANVTTVWEGFGYSRYRNVSIQDDLKLFHISEDGSKILMFSHYEDKSSQIPNREYESTQQGQLESTLSVVLGVSSGTVPKKPFVMKIGEIISSAKDG